MIQKSPNLIYLFRQRLLRAYGAMLKHRFLIKITDYYLNLRENVTQVVFQMEWDECQFDPATDYCSLEQLIQNESYLPELSDKKPAASFQSMMLNKILTSALHYYHIIFNS